MPGGVNFSVFSQHANSCTLVLFEGKRPGRDPCRGMFGDPRVPRGEFRIGNVFAMIVFDLDYENIEYGFRMDGPFDPAQPATASTRPRSCSTPTPGRIGGRDVWGEQPDWDDLYPYRGRLVFDDFDWEGDRPLESRSRT